MRLDVFGSSANGFGMASSDLDLGLVVVGGLARAEAPAAIAAAAAALESARARGDGAVCVAAASAAPLMFEEVNARTTSRIPICLFVDSASGLDCDVSVENPLAARNTALLHTCVLFVEQTTLRDHVSRG